MSVESQVKARYADAANEQEPALCCPVDYDAELLKILPQEIIDKDYGCGDPSRYVKEGDVVLDLGSGGGKICYMAAQLVGVGGRVIGVDMTDDMLALARRYQPEMAEKIGEDRVEFHKGNIQDLALDLDVFEAYLAENPVNTVADYQRGLEWQQQQRSARPMIADGSVDLVVSNCVLNLVSDEHKQQMISEIYRVLAPGGRIAISDIVSDERVPQHLKDDPDLWSGCISGAFQESDFLQAVTDAGFFGAKYDKWDAEPWQTVEGIEFRSVTLTATKGHGTECLDYGHAVIYRGPYSEVYDDDEHVYPRGERIAVCERTYKFLTENPVYRDDFIGIPPAVKNEPMPWCAPAGTLRSAAESKGAVHAGAASDCCADTNACC